MNYRKIWEKHFGSIPEDELGRKYEIHHIDGDRKNNDIGNLKCLSIREHYNLHKEQGDWMACYRIRMRLSLTKEEQLELNRKIAESKLGKVSPTKGTKYPKYICEYCNREIGQKINLVKHERSCIKNQNRVHTPNNKMAEKKLGTKHSKETKQKMSQAKKGRPLSEVHKQKLSEAVKGKPWSEKRKQALINKNK
jgi:K+-sensing histidine kinase KdpD